MARSRLGDVMQAYPFWVFDATGAPIFDPVLGFSAVTAPEISVELQEIRAGNWQYTHRVVKSASVGAISMSRGTRFYDSDFYRWITRAIRGEQPVRRNLVLVHFLGFRPLRETLKRAGLRGSQTGPETGASSLVERLPGRAWYLADCLPTRYKAGSDFDATSGDVSVAELEVQPEYVLEMTTATMSAPLSATGSAALTLGGFV